jgi:hypothetical protein
MKRTAYVAALLLFSCALSTACRGQDAARPGGGSLDPALIATVDSMLPKLEVLSGLRKLKPVALAEQSREELRRYVEQRLAEEMPPSELEGLRQTYAAFGLIPDTLNIKALLLDLYQEQVAGYYDPVTEKFYLMKGTPVAMLRPVLAHELVHALQDQHTNLDSLIARERGSDRQSAAQAAIEGHATIVMFAFLTQEATGRAPRAADMPDIGAQLKPALDAQNSQFPVFKRAPRIIRETMVFPYVGGAVFTQKLWVARADQGYPAPLGTLLPQSTEQVMHPEQAFLTTRDAPTEVRFANTKDVIYENTLGELEMGILLSEHLGVDAATAARGWDGDRYQLLKVGDRKMLVWQTLWDDAASADRFKAAYGQLAPKRPRTIRIQRNVVEGREGVLIFDAERGIDTISLAVPAVRLLK